MKRFCIQLTSLTAGLMLTARLLAPGIAQAQGAWSIVPNPNPASTDALRQLPLLVHQGGSATTKAAFDRGSALACWIQVLGPSYRAHVRHPL